MLRLQLLTGDTITIAPTVTTTSSSEAILQELQVSIYTVLLVIGDFIDVCSQRTGFCETSTGIIVKQRQCSPCL